MTTAENALASNLLALNQPNVNYNQVRQYSHYREVAYALLYGAGGKEMHKDEIVSEGIRRGLLNETNEKRDGIQVASKINSEIRDPRPGFNRFVRVRPNTFKLLSYDTFMGLPIKDLETALGQNIQNNAPPMQPHVGPLPSVAPATIQSAVPSAYPPAVPQNMPAPLAGPVQPFAPAVQNAPAYGGIQMMPFAPMPAANNFVYALPNLNYGGIQFSNPKAVAHSMAKSKGYEIELVKSDDQPNNALPENAETNDAKTSDANLNGESSLGAISNNLGSIHSSKSGESSRSSASSASHSRSHTSNRSQVLDKNEEKIGVSFSTRISTGSRLSMSNSFNTFGDKSEKQSAGVGSEGEESPCSHCGKRGRKSGDGKRGKESKSKVQKADTLIHNIVDILEKNHGFEKSQKFNITLREKKGKDLKSLVERIEAKIKK